MDRARLGLSILAVAAAGAVAVLVLLAGCGSTTAGNPTTAATSPATSTTTTTPAPPSPSGYPLATGARHEVSAGQTGTTLEVEVGDVVVAPDAVPDVALAIRAATETGALVHAENTAGGLVFQAVGPGSAVVLTGPVPAPASCRGKPCPGRAAPPSVTVRVKP